MREVWNYGLLDYYIFLDAPDPLHAVVSSLHLTRVLLFDVKNFRSIALSIIFNIELGG